MRTVSEVAALAGVTVRALHHYDEIGLLRPSGRSESGYRLYAHEDLLRLQEIVAWQQLGFTLREVQALLDERGYDRADALRRQRALAAEEMARYAGIVEALDAAIAAQRTGRRLEEETMFEGFDAAAHAEEAERRWGNSGAYRESRRRAARYSDEEWEKIGAEATAIEAALANCLEAGAAPTDAGTLALAERHREHISRWFYDCAPEIHRGLAELYLSDPRFRAHWDAQRPGLAEFVHAAFLANSARALPPD
jgi:DNA-binding transcriptional MerR regulator